MGVLPDAPIPAALAQRPEALRSERRGWGWNSLTRHHFGMSTGQARRACLLNSACLRASGASPRHSAIAGVVQQQNAAVPRPRRRCDSVHPLHFRPCGVVQPARLPVSQEITGAKPVRDASFIAPKALSAMHSLGKRISPVQLRVGAPLLLTVRNGGHAQASQSSQRSGGFHKPAVSRAALETARHLHAGHFASTQQPADFFCKEILPGQHRLEAPSCGAAQAARVAQCRGTTSRASPVRVQVPSRAPISWSRSHSRPAPGFYPDMVRVQLPPAPPIHFARW